MDIFKTLPLAKRASKQFAKTNRTANLLAKQEAEGKAMAKEAEQEISLFYDLTNLLKQQGMEEEEAQVAALGACSFIRGYRKGMNFRQKISSLFKKEKKEEVKEEVKEAVILPFKSPDPNIN